MRKLSVLLLATLFMVPGVGAFGDSSVEVNFDERLPGQGLGQDVATSYFQGVTSSSSNGFNQRLCSSTSDNKCLDMAQWDYFAILPSCVEGDFDQCVKTLRITVDGKLIDASYVKSAGGIKYQADPILKTPDGGNVSVWSARNSNGQTDFFAVKALVAYTGKSRTAGSVTGMNAQVFKIKRVSIPGADYGVAEHTWPAGNISVDGAGGPNGVIDCIYFAASECGEVLQESGLRASLELKLDNRVTGWMSARMDEPDIKVTVLNSTTNLLEITGTAVGVPFIKNILSRSELPSDMKNVGTGADGSLPPGTIGLHFPSPQQFSIGMFLKLQNLLKPQATGITQTWSIRAIPQAQNPCLASTSKLVGLVMTNSTAYEVAPPTFTDGTLNYKVASLHFAPDGSVFQGEYNLLISSTAARCLFGFGNAPVSASVSIVGDQGSQSVVASTIKEIDGWIYLRVSGFTFSNPTIQVKLQQEGAIAPVVQQPATASPNPAPTLAATPGIVKPALLKSTITCVKGKTSKKVTALKPVCPKGYIKK